MEAISLTQRNLFQAANFVVKMAAVIATLGTVVIPAAGQPSAASGQFLPYKAPRRLWLQPIGICRIMRRSPGRIPN